MKVYSFSDIGSLVDGLGLTSPSAEQEYFDQVDEQFEPVTREWSGLVTRTVNYIYPDGRTVSRKQNIFSSRRCDSEINIIINK